MSANNNLHRTSEEEKAQEENEEEEETYDEDDDGEEEDDHVDDDSSEEIPELIPPRGDTISDSDDTENETDEDTEEEIRVRVLPSMMLLQLVQTDYIYYEKKYERNEDETRSVYPSPETVDVVRIINGWTLGRPLMDQYFRSHHESPSIEFNQLSYGRNIDSDESDE